MLETKNVVLPEGVGLTQLLAQMALSVENAREIPTRSDAACLV